MIIKIEGLEKADVLAVLWNNAYLVSPGGWEMTSELAAKILSENTSCWFDEVEGRRLRIDLSGDRFDGQWYDEDYGEGKAADAITWLRETTS